MFLAAAAGGSAGAWIALPLVAALGGCVLSVRPMRRTPSLAARSGQVGAPSVPARADRAGREPEEVPALPELDPRVDLLLRHGTEVVMVLDRQRRIRYASPSVEGVLGSCREELVGGAFDALLHPGDAREVSVMLAQARVHPESPIGLRHRLRRSDGSWWRVSTVITDFLDEAAMPGIVLNIRDVDEREALEDQLRRLAFQDSLTSLPNRALFTDRVTHALARSPRTGEQVAVLVVDLDDFKRVNDALGHRIGDQLIQGVASRMAAVARPGDTLCRLGGDEFALLVENVRDPSHAVAVAQRVLLALRTPLVLADREVAVGASIGIALGLGDGDGADDLLRKADVAMSIAKAGRRGYQLFEPAMQRAAVERLERDAELRRAVERGEFVLHYQPLVDLGNGELLGVEALVRWLHPERGILPPGDFIGMAEQNGLIVPIGRWVLGEATRRARAWQERFGRPLRVAVNISPKHLQGPSLDHDVRRALEESGLPSESLVLEITESVLMQDTEDMLERLAGLRRQGVRLAIDDFGAGYSSLGYLGRFPVDLLKIDRSFVRSLGGSVEDSAVVRAILSLASTFNLDTVAEGIETPTQLAELRTLGCPVGQGFLISRPLEEEALLPLLAEGTVGEGWNRGD
ncbi:MAG: putative bifunctional diguanylate cyclase/phosphodiesterase [Actinomycetota bacterium]